LAYPAPEQYDFVDPVAFQALCHSISHYKPGSRRARSARSIAFRKSLHPNQGHFQLRSRSGRPQPGHRKAPAGIL